MGRSPPGPRLDRRGWPVLPALPPDIEGLGVDFEKDEYSNSSISAKYPPFTDITLLRKIDWREVTTLRYGKEGRPEAGAREILASQEWSVADVALQKYLFEEQATFRPAIRRRLGDAHVGKAARYWLDMLGDPADADLFPGGRKSAPKQEVREADLVDAIKAISCG